MPLVRVHHRRHDGMQDICHALQDSHQSLTTAGTTTVLKSVQRAALWPLCGSRETWMAVASGSEQLNNSASCLFGMDQYTKISFLVDTGTNLCVYPHSHLPECWTQTSYELFAANGTTIHNPAFGFGPMTGVFMAFCHCRHNRTHHRFGLSLLLQLTR